METSIKISLVAIIVGFVLYFLYSKYYRNVENYGGPIKNIKKIPMTDCYGLCDSFAAKCFISRDIISDVCQRRRDSCRAECYYSNAQRIM